MEDFGTARLDIPLDSWPESFPNVAQTKLLLRHGVAEPTVASLTRIGTVEGFGGMLRLLPIPDFIACFEEDITGTAIAHIGGGLFEAHARDEAGHGDEAGHNVMWFAARDIAFDHPLTEDQTAHMLERMGIGAGPRTDADIAQMRRAAEAGRALPADIDFTLEILVGRMIGLLLIEISAFHGFAWAEAVLSDTDLVAGEGEAARLVAHIRQDETPARRLAADRPHRDARPDMEGLLGASLPRHRDDRPVVGAGHQRFAAAAPARQPGAHHEGDRAGHAVTGLTVTISSTRCSRSARCSREPDGTLVDVASDQLLG